MLFSDVTFKKLFLKRIQRFRILQRFAQISIDRCAFMPREAEPSLNERKFILEALREDIRLDGRTLDGFRDLDISFGEEYGLADVTLGTTRYNSRHHGLQISS